MVIAYLLSFYILLIGLIPAAWRWGEQPERMGAAAFVVAAAASIVFRARGSASWSNIETGVLLIDVLLLGWLVWLAMRSGRRWATICASLQLITLLAHVAKALNPGLRRLGYALMEGVWSYAMLLVLASALWRLRHHRFASATSSVLS